MYVGTDPLLFNNAGVAATLFNDSGDSVTYDLDRIAGNEIGTLNAGQSASITTPVWVRSQGQSQIHIEVAPPAASSGGQSNSANAIVKRPEDYGAKRDGRETFDAAMTNASAVLTCASAPFTSADVGKAINVKGVGVSGRELSTTILSFQSATQVTLAAVANATVTGKQAIWGTDDTSAIRQAVAAAVSAAQADKSCYAEVQFSSGIYVVAAATTKGGATRGNAQVPLPPIPPGTGQKVTLVLKGTADAGAWGHWNQAMPQKSGAVVRSMLVEQAPDGTWGSPSVFGAMTADLTSPTEAFSNMRVIVDGLTVVCPRNPSVIAMDLRRCAQADVVNFAALADDTPFNLNTSATDSNGIGLYMPMQNNNDSCNIGVYSCEGFYYGIGYSDHLVAHRLGIIYTNTAMFINDTAGGPVHGASILYASVEACSTVIEKPDSSGNQFPIFIGQLNVEGVTGTAIKDPGNNLRGEILWSVNATAADPSVSGAGQVKVINVQKSRGALAAPAVPASTVAAPVVFRDAMVNITGGTVTAVTIDGQATGLTSGSFFVPAGKTIAVTYSVAPTWKWTLL